MQRSDTIEMKPCDEASDAVDEARRQKDEAEYELIRRWKEDGDKSAIEALYDTYSGFIARVAQDYAQYAPLRDKEDYLQYARIGFLLAVNKFDPSVENASLPAYARWWMKSELKNYHAKNKVIHKRPKNVAESDQEIVREFNRLGREHNGKNGYCPPTVDERREIGRQLKARLGEEDNKRLGDDCAGAYYKAMAIFMTYYGGYDSLDAPLDSHDSPPRVAFLTDEFAVTQEQEAHQISLKHFIDDVLEDESFSGQERDVIRLHMLGPEDGDALSVKEVADVLEVKHQCIDQIEQCARAKFRIAARDKILLDQGYAVNNDKADIVLDVARKSERQLDKKIGIKETDGVAFIMPTMIAQKGNACAEWVHKNDRPVIILDKQKKLKGAIIPPSMAETLLDETPYAEHMDVPVSFFTRRFPLVQKMGGDDFSVSLKKHSNTVAVYMSPDLTVKSLASIKMERQASVGNLFTKAGDMLRSGAANRTRPPPVSELFCHVI